jgi:hypothetical protein
MTQGESGPFANHNVSMHEPSSIPIDEDPAAMHALFDATRHRVVVDIDAYTGGEFDAHNDFRMAPLLGKTSLAIQEEFTTQMVRAARSPVNVDMVSQATRMRRAHEITETIEIMNLFCYEAEDPKEAWERGLDTAATARFRRELAKEEEVLRRGQAIVNLALNMRRNTGQ